MSANNIEGEMKTANALLDEGMSFKAGRLRFTVRQSTLGTLLRIGKVYNEIQLNEDSLDSFRDVYIQSEKNVRYMAKVLAISVLNKKSISRILTYFMTVYFLRHITPSKLLQLVQILLVMNNVGDFINSIRLVSTLKLLQIETGNRVEV